MNKELFSGLIYDSLLRLVLRGTNVNIYYILAILSSPQIETRHNLDSGWAQKEKVVVIPPYNSFRSPVNRYVYGAVLESTNYTIWMHYL